MRRIPLLLVLWLALAGTLSPARAEVVLGQLETFDEPHNWVIGFGPGGATPSPVPTALGGPAGPDDPYLSIVSLGGDGPRSRLSAQNLEDWTGNYLAAGVDVISMDVRNFEATDLFLRLLFLEFGPMGPVSAAFSTEAILVSGGSGWQTIHFDVSPSALTAVPFPPPSGGVLDALGNAGELRILHNPAPFFAPGMLPAVVGQLGVDNITAGAATRVPEPATGVLVLFGLLATRLATRRRT